MKEEVIKIILGWVEHNEPLETTADKILDLVDQSKQLGCKFCGADEGLKHGYMPDGEPCPMNNQEKCKCENPVLQPQTKQCGKCKMYIDRVRHIVLTN